MNENNGRVAVSGSERSPVFGAKVVSSVPGGEQISVTLVLRRRRATAAAMPGARYGSREEFGAVHGADPHDVEVVKNFAHEQGLAVVEVDAASRTVVLSGPASSLEAAFGSKLDYYEVAGDQKGAGLRYRGRTGSVLIPAPLQPAITAVLGLDNRPVATPKLRKQADSKNAAAGGGFTPAQIAQLYGFPSGLDGAGQTIAILELGGGYKVADLKTYFKNLGIKAPKVVAVSVDGGKNHTGSDADAEVQLDIQVAGAVASGATIVVYFAPNTDQGFRDALARAVHDTQHKPSVVSISWGGPETAWTDQARIAFDDTLQDAAAIGVTVTVAAGDSGSTDGVDDGKQHVDFPASSPHVLATGGTRIAVSSGGIQLASEVVWNELGSNEGATGGGVSNAFPLPDYQKGANVPRQPDTHFAGRGIPDVAGDADPVTGYIVRVDGRDEVIGGTSAVAPLWAGLIALFNQHLGKPLGFVNPLLYQIGVSAFNDVVSGNDGKFAARKGWDAATGLGSPNGKKLLEAIQQLA